MTSNPETVSYWQAREIAFREHRTVEAVQREEHAKAAFPDLLKKESDVLAKRRDEIARKQTAIEHEEAQLVAAVQEWESLLQKWNDAKRRLQVGDDQLAQLRAQLQGRVAYLDQRCWGETRDRHCFPEQICDLYSGVLGTEKAIADYPRWREERQGELEGIGSELSAFARQHGIESNKLPSELQGK